MTPAHFVRHTTGARTSLDLQRCLPKYNGRLTKRLSRFRYVARHALRGRARPGYCPICERRVFFCTEGTWLRDQLRCSVCWSIPRWRAIIHVLQQLFPEWRKLRIHESSPGGATSDKLARECTQIIQTHFFPDTTPGDVKNGYRCENLEAQTFPDAAFDLVVTQDVFEHVLDPAAGFREVARTLKPGGAHVFTIPWYYWKPTLTRAVRSTDGSVQLLVEADYHGNPIDSSGSLVVTEWGWEFCDFVYRASGMTTTAVRIYDPSRGIAGEFIEVFVSRKPDAVAL